MFKTLKNFIFANPEPPISNTVIVEALNRYCEKCKRGFKTKAAKGAHTRSKHKIT